MNELIPIAFFVGCMLVTIGLVRVCEWLRPPDTTRHAENARSHQTTAWQRKEGSAQ